MLIAWLQTLLTTPISQGRLTGHRRSYFFWLGLSLAVSLGYAVLALEEPLSQTYVVQDDARQYLFWMQRSLDPSLFPHDLIANYFQSVTPLGYKALYGGAIALGIHPFQFNIVLPTILGLIATQYLFRLTFTILPIPFTAWIASVVFNQTIWMKDDLVSATPRAFVYPLFLAFLFYWVTFDQTCERSPRSSFIPLDRAVTPSKTKGVFRHVNSIILACTVSLGLLGLFYPQYVLLAGAMLGIAMIADGTLMDWIGLVLRRKRGLRARSKTRFYLSTITTILIVILYYATTSSVYGPVVTLAQAKAMPEFWPGGRNFFFSTNLWWFYGVGDRSGLLHVGLVRPATLALGLFLPLILRFPRRFPLINAITPALYRLGHLLLASTALFIAAHLFLFRLHLPSRYTDHSLRMIMAIAAALTLTLVLDALLPKSNIQTLKSIGAIAFTLFIFILLLAYPQFVDPFPLTKYKVGRFPETYAYLRTQPKDILIASVAKEADNIPIFAQRSILIGHEYAIPYHTGYYDQFRRRAIALLKAQYTTDKQELAQFIEGYGIDFWLLETDAYNDDYLNDHWIRQYAAKAALAPDNTTFISLLPQEELRQEHSTQSPLLQRLQGRCTILKEGDLKVIDAGCVVNNL